MVPADRAMVSKARRPRTRIVADPVTSARATGLRYVTDRERRLGRRRTRTGFRYLDQRGRPLRDPGALRRIRALAIPPAWTDVWICASANGHLQATGRDARGRKQYRYHPRWRVARDETKYGRMLLFAEALPRIRKHVAADLARPGLPREKVLATVVRLLERTLVRVGNEEYAHENHSYGLTTLRTRHVRIGRGKMQFRFRAKSGKLVAVELSDARLARIVKRCRDLPGHELFQYLDDDGRRQSVGSADVNTYVRETSGEDFTAKDFRTWPGTVLAALALAKAAAFSSETDAKRRVVRAIAAAADRLGNTPSVCRKGYVHPAVIDAYMGGATIEVPAGPCRESRAGLRPEEKALVALLRRELPVETRRAG